MRVVGDNEKMMHTASMEAETMPMATLKNTMRWMTGEELITDVASEYYD